MPRKGKGKRVKYNPVDLDKAVTAVKNKILSIRKAAKYYGVPKSTISDRITGRVQDGALPGKKPVFPIEIETQIATKIKDAARMGFGITRAHLCFKMGRLATQMKLKTPFRNGVPGRDWFDGFRKRNPDIVFRSPTPLNNVRARMLNPEVTKKYFAGLEKTLTELNLMDKPKQIWNIDETNVSLTHKPSRILAEVGQKNVPGRVGNCRDGVTALACINASGCDIPPLVIVKGLTEKAVHAYNVREGPTGTKYTFQKKAWMEDLLGISWFNDHFLKHCGPERPQLIILDSHSSHETLGLIDAARQNDIVLFALPPHTTQYLNPLDKTVFGPFQRHYDRQCTDFMSSSPSNLVTKWEWPRLFKLAYEATVVKENIVKGFEVCGIIPFNPAKVPVSAFAPSVPFDKEPETLANIEPVDAPVNANVTPEVQNDSENVSTDLDRAVAPPMEIVMTADENGVGNIFHLDDAEVLLDLITNGNIDIIESQDADTSVQELVSQTDERPSTSSTSIADISWNSEIDALFSLKASPDPQKSSSKKSKQIKSHRLLTSDEIFLKKKAEKEEKERQEREKEERKQKRLEKREEKRKLEQLGKSKGGIRKKLKK